MSIEGFFDVLKNTLGKALTFITSRRVWLLGILAALFSVLGFVGLDSDIATQMTAATAGVVDQTAIVIAEVSVLLERIAVLVGLTVVAYKMMVSFHTRPPVMEDWKETSETNAAMKPAVSVEIVEIPK